MVSPCSIMVYHGFRSKEAKRARKQKYRLRQKTSHSSLLVARQGDVSRKLNQALLLVDMFNFNFAGEERSDICKQQLLLYNNNLSKNVDLTSCYIKLLFGSKFFFISILCLKLNLLNKIYLSINIVLPR